MPAAARLTPDERDAALQGLSGWSLVGDGAAIARTFKFADFGEAFGFMARAALAAERMDHHPEWSNSWNTVAVTLSTHSAGGLTANDIALARAMNAIAGR
jgi:4a-hydroxytetrahydrobiopterin dehydratase